MATERQPQTRGATKQREDDGAKAREYRDAQGNVHHHTRSYMEQHGAAKGAAGGGARSEERSGKAAPRKGGASSDANAEAEAMTESEDELEIQVAALLAIAQMDGEAAAAYEAAAELIDEEEVSAQLREFAGDHQRHVEDIGKLVEQLGAEPEVAAPPPEASVFATLASAVGVLGVRAALLTLGDSEQFTNATYSTALELITDPNARAVLQRNLADEERHLAWLSAQTSEVEPGEQPQPTGEN